ncbi:MAG: TIGR01212 family radical SAM protein, partial [Gallionellaceae bacterium]|nr:TIGR01212 family radical SAM protein [Gallionellaceae bacterium]
MALSDYINTFGQHMLKQHGERVHKIALDAGMTCPNRDGSTGKGGCTFCNNASFSPNGNTPPSLIEQINRGKLAIGNGTRAPRFLAYFQAYTNTYADVADLAALYEEALSE